MVFILVNAMRLSFFTVHSSVYNEKNCLWRVSAEYHMSYVFIDYCFWLILSFQDRITFRRIVLKNAFMKRKMYENLLECVPMLKTLDVSIDSLVFSIRTQFFKLLKNIIHWYMYMYVNCYSLAGILH